jgi:pimeloyl-ACP methyl ester carboxylesterase
VNPLLLLHGALGSADQLSPLKTALKESYPLIYSLNFSGHSGEPFSASGFGIEAFAEDILNFMDNEGLSNTNIFGYSMGGYVAMWFAHTYPERVGRIVTLGTKFDWSPDSAEKEIRKLDPDKILLKVPAFARILEHRHAPNDWKVVLQKTSSMMLGLGNQPLLTEDILRTIKAKITIALGDQDDMADRTYSKRVSELLPFGDFVLLENIPHPIEKVDLNVLTQLISKES